MLKINFSYLFSIMCIYLGYAHDADIAFFNVSIKENKTLIEAELPWSIRNVLIAYDSNYLNAKSKEETRAFFLEYAREKLKLYNKKGNQLKLLNVKVNSDKENTHSHSIKYILTFEGADVYKIENTLMLDYYKFQKNYHWFINNLGNKKEKITSKGYPSFILKQKKNNQKEKNNSLFIVFLVLFSMLGAFLLCKKK